jgi:hypothetical protein
MRVRVIASKSCWLAWLLVPHLAATGGEILTPIQTRSTSAAGVLVATNWGPGTSGVTSPLSFQQFDPKLGTLDEIDITLTTTIRNDYKLIFVKTPIPTTIFVATSATSDPKVLANPAKRALLTDGPTVTLFAPNGRTQIFGPPATRQPVDFVQLTEKSGTWSSLLPITDPKFIPPTMTEQSFSRTLTNADAHSLFSDFIGTGKVNLPVTATAFSSFFTSSGNGGGAVLTKARAVVSIQYGYSPSAIPEPSSRILLCLGVALGSLAVGSHRRAPRHNRTSASREVHEARVVDHLA